MHVRLEGEGLVLVYPNRGALVAELGAEDVREIHDLRVLLECDSLEHAVPHMTQGELEELDHVLARVRRQSEGPSWWKGDWDFHRTLSSTTKGIEPMPSEHRAPVGDPPGRSADRAGTKRSLTHIVRR